MSLIFFALFVHIIFSSTLTDHNSLQPQEITDIKKFLELAKRPDAKKVTRKNPKKKGGVTKFKIRCARVSMAFYCFNYPLIYSIALIIVV
jgi:hypothetical protein